MRETGEDFRHGKFGSVAVTAEASGR